MFIPTYECVYIYGRRRAVTTMMSFVWETGVRRIKFAGGVHYWSHLRQRKQFSCDCYTIVSIIIYMYTYIGYIYTSILLPVGLVPYFYREPENIL